MHMRLIQFLNEDREIDIIKQQCQEFLAEWKRIGFDKAALYRGTSQNIANSQSFKPSLWRAPRDTSWNAHEYVDNFYKKTLGYALRSEAMFLTHHKESAKAYGNVYYFIPTGKYSLFTNSLVRDLFIDVFAPINSGKIPSLCESGEILNPRVIINSTNIPYKVDPSMGFLLWKTANKVLLPSICVLPESQKRSFVKSMEPMGLYLNGRLISEGVWDKIKTAAKIAVGAYAVKKFMDLNKEVKNLKKQVSAKQENIINLSADEAFDLFWKPCFDELERKINYVLSQTKRVSLLDACAYNHEIMCICNEYYLVTEQVAKKLWK